MIRLFLLLSTFALLFGSCQKNVPQKHSAQKILRLNLSGDPNSLDPRIGFNRNCQVIRCLYEGLMRLDLNGKPALALAESYSLSDDFKTYTFHLRDALWTNQMPITAFDFEYAWKSIIAPESECAIGNLFYPIKNAQEAKEKRVSLDEVGIKALDEKTLVVTLEHPTAYFLELVSNPIFSPLCKPVVEKDINWDKKEDQSLVCNGPFRLKEWHHGDLFVVEKNPFYFDRDHVHLDEIHFHLVKDAYTALLMYEKGKLDWIGDPFTKLPREAIRSLQAEGKLESCPIASVFWLECNTQMFPLTSSNIRKALALAIDRNELVESLFPGHQIALSCLPSSMQLGVATALSKSGNAALAQHYFDEGLKELQLTRDSFPAIKLTFGELEGQKALSQVVQDQWKKNLGIEVILDGYEWTTYLDLSFNHKLQMGGFYWYSLVNDPIINLEAFKFRSAPSNGTLWEDSAYQNLLNLSDEEADLDVRYDYLRKAEAILQSEMPIIPLYNEVYLFAKQPHVHRVNILPSGDADLKECYLDE